MNFKGIEIEIKNKPPLEPNFIPAYKFIEGYLKGATQPFAFAWERNDGYAMKYDTFIYGTAEKSDLDLFYLNQVIEFTFYCWGGWKLYLCGNKDLSEKLIEAYVNEQNTGLLSMFASRFFGRQINFEILPYQQCPQKNESVPIGKHLDGCRIGFDAGASDRKVSAVIDGKTVYSEEVLWYAKFSKDIDYIYNEIVTAFKTAASKMPQVDAIGVSTAGIIVDQLMLGASFYKMLAPEVIAEKGQDIYQRAAREIGDDMALMVLNDGQVSALAGSMNVGKNKLWGVAIGTSIGTGYVDGEGNLTDLMTEISSAKIAYNQDAALDESGMRIGVGESYFSQNSVIARAKEAGIEMDDKLYPAEKLLIVQDLMAKDDPRVVQIFKNIGICFAHTIPLADRFFDIENIYLLGRVVSAKGGDTIVAECRRVLEEEYPEISKKITIWLPNEQQRRVSQSVAAASLPELKKNK